MAAATDPPTIDKPKRDWRRRDARGAKCGSKTRSGGTCGRPAGAGTDHPGHGHCKLHGGNTQNGQKFAARQQVLELGGELDMEPHEAILLAVRKAAMQVAFCAARVAELREEELLAERVKVVRDADGSTRVEKTNEQHLNVWVRLHQEAVRDLSHLAKVAVDAGVAERQVRLAEQLVGDIAAVLRAYTDQLELTAAQKKRAPAAARAALQLIEGGKAAAA